MTVAEMAKQKAGRGSEGAAPAPALPVAEPGAGADKKAPKETSLKVDAGDGELVGKVAKMRGVSIANLFKQPDVQDFFSHLLIREMEKETARLQARKKS